MNCLRHPSRAWLRDRRNLSCVVFTSGAALKQQNDNGQALRCDAGVSPVELCGALTDGREAHVREAALLRVQHLQNFLKSFQGMFTLSLDLHCDSLLVTAWDEDTVMQD